MIGGELIPQIYILYVLFSLYETNDGFHKHKNFTRRHFLKTGGDKGGGQGPWPP